MTQEPRTPNHHRRRPHLGYVVAVEVLPGRQLGGPLAPPVGRRRRRALLLPPMLLLVRRVQLLVVPGVGGTAAPEPAAAARARRRRDARDAVGILVRDRYARPVLYVDGPLQRQH